MKRTSLSQFGCLTPAALISTLVAVVLVAGITFLRGGLLFSAGPLNAQVGMPRGGVTSHAEISACDRCHPAPWSGQTMNSACQACHTEVSDAANFHTGLLKSNPGLKCGACHSEHHGANGALTTISKQGFPHDSVGFSLNAHQKMADGTPFGCAGCHKDSYSAAFNVRVCADCHATLKPDFMIAHLAAYGTGCLVCHDGLESYGNAFDHTKTPFVLTGKHLPLDCAKCHQGARSIADLKATQTKCAACHIKDDAHQDNLGSDCGACHTPDDWNKAAFDHNLVPFKLVGQHIPVKCEACHTQGFKGTPSECFACHADKDVHQGDLGKVCVACHSPVEWKQASIEHSITGFSLEGKHFTAKCTDCHTNSIWKGIPRDCYSCHKKDDHHNGTLGTDCSLCHAVAGWVPSTFDHAKSAFPLVGKHQAVQCMDCHANGAFKGTPTNCYSCHKKDDKHGGEFGTDCSVCHAASGWLPSTFNHANFFVLTGAHVNVACARCHGTGTVDVMRFKGTPTNCSACHADPAYHAGLFGLDCKSCHNSGAWLPGQFNRSHGFEMGHGGASSCRDCHPTSLATYNCDKCHPGGAPKDNGGGGGN